mmetsp:Transcript_25727/g.38685  ORF Transcript_25727/g.38685 Transcript_25727/m.38685 type:complete len:217 (-) Transcript_25727:242-892(-)
MQPPHIHGILCGVFLLVIVRDLVGQHAKPLAFEHLDAEAGEGRGQGAAGARAVDVPLRINQDQPLHRLRVPVGELEGDAPAERGPAQGHGPPAHHLPPERVQVVQLRLGREVLHSQVLVEAPAQNVQRVGLLAPGVELRQEAAELAHAGVEPVQQHQRRGAPRLGRHPGRPNLHVRGFHGQLGDVLRDGEGHLPDALQHVDGLVLFDLQHFWKRHT